MFQSSLIVRFNPVESVIQHPRKFTLHLFDLLFIFHIVGVPDRTAILQSAPNIRVIKLDQASRTFEALSTSEDEPNQLIRLFRDFFDVSSEAFFTIKRDTEILFDRFLFNRRIFYGVMIVDRLWFAGYRQR